MEIIKGQVWKYGDDVNTDVIFPGKYTYTITDPDQMREHALEDLDPSFRDGVAKSFARIYYRNCLNAALPALTCPELFDQVEQGDEITVDLSQGKITFGEVQFSFPPLPDAVQALFAAGGLIPYTRQKLALK
jgi:3-isopropylmalate/(R)-2-methylmalate dehydratase small subunit